MAGKNVAASPTLVELGAGVLHHGLLLVQVIGDGDNRKEDDEGAAESQEALRRSIPSAARSLARPPEVEAGRR